MSTYGSTRTERLARGTRVICNLVVEKPERVSKRTGELRPASRETRVLSGTVLVDRGDSVYVRVTYPSGYAREVTFFAHEVVTEEQFKKGSDGLSQCDTLPTVGSINMARF